MPPLTVNRGNVGQMLKIQTDTATHRVQTVT